MSLTQGQIEYEIKELFGRGRRDFEISHEGFTAAINKSLRMFKRHVLGRKCKVAENVANKGFVDVTEGDASDDPLPLGVLNVKFLSEADYSTVDDTFDVFSQRNIQSNKYAFVLLEKMDFENRQRVLGTEPEWHYDDANKRLFIYSPSGAVDIGYEVAYPLDSLSVIPVSYEALFMDCVEGHIRKSLGDIRGKFGGTIPGPTGDITMDADVQRSEGNDILNRVREDLMNIQDPVPPIWG